MRLFTALTAAAFMMVSGLACAVDGESPDAVPADKGPALATPAEDDISALLGEAGRKSGQKEWEQAADFFARAASADPSSEEAVLGLGTAKIEMGEYGEAMRLLGPLLNLYPDSALLKNNIAWTLIMATDPAVRDVPRGLMLAQGAMLSADRDPNVWNTLCEAHYAAGQYRMALRTARIALWLASGKKPAIFREFEATLLRCARTVAAAGDGADGKGQESEE